MNITTPDGVKWIIKDGAYTVLSKNGIQLDTLSEDLFDILYPNYKNTCNQEQTDL